MPLILMRARCVWMPKTLSELVKGSSAKVTLTGEGLVCICTAIQSYKRTLHEKGKPWLEPPDFGR